MTEYEKVKKSNEYWLLHPRLYEINANKRIAELTKKLKDRLREQEEMCETGKR